MKAPAKILLALDSGETIVEAWREASAISRTFGAPIVLVHAIPEAGEFSPEFDVVSTQIFDLFEDLTRGAKDAGVEVTQPFEIRSGQPSEVIRDVARERKADLIVIGAGNKSTLDRLLLGSTAERVMREAEQPVWLVRPGRGHDDVKRIVAAVDGSAPGREALAAAVMLARTFTARLTLLEVRASGAGGTTWRDELDLHGIDLETLQLEGDVVESLLKAAQEKSCDLLIIGEAGRQGFARLLKANTAEAVVRKVPCSLLAVKALT